jgi:hypothetical protein
MKVEHITHKGTSAIRDTKDINLLTLDRLKQFQVYGIVDTIDFPLTDLHVKITSTDSGAIFDIFKEDRLASTNLCCFEEHHKEKMIKLIESLTRILPFQKTEINRYPSENTFIYSVMVDPLALSPIEWTTAGEIELYIYYSLYLAHKRHNI